MIIMLMLGFTFPITIQVLNNGWFNHCVNMVESSSYWRANIGYSCYFQGSYFSLVNMYLGVVRILNSFYWCRCFSTSHYIRLCQPTCQLCCKLLTGCGFIGHKVCRNCHKDVYFTHTYCMTILLSRESPCIIIWKLGLLKKRVSIWTLAWDILN